jgi:hypothetical protein
MCAGPEGSVLDRPTDVTSRWGARRVRGSLDARGDSPVRCGIIPSFTLYPFHACVTSRFKPPVQKEKRFKPQRDSGTWYVQVLYNSTHSRTSIQYVPLQRFLTHVPVFVPALVVSRECCAYLMYRASERRTVRMVPPGGGGEAHGKEWQDRTGSQPKARPIRIQNLLLCASKQPANGESYAPPSAALVASAAYRFDAVCGMWAEPVSGGWSPERTTTWRR